MRCRYQSTLARIPIPEVEPCLLQKVEIDKQTPTLKAQKDGVMEVSVRFPVWPELPSCSWYMGHSCCSTLLYWVGWWAQPRQSSPAAAHCLAGWCTQLVQTPYYLTWFAACTCGRSGAR